jgi:hypothetical protein
MEGAAELGTEEDTAVPKIFPLHGGVCEANDCDVANIKFLGDLPHGHSGLAQKNCLKYLLISYFPEFMNDGALESLSIRCRFFSMAAKA